MFFTYLFFCLLILHLPSHTYTFPTCCCVIEQKRSKLVWNVFIWFQSGQLNEYTERKEMSSDVQCMALGTVPAGEQRSRFLAIGLSDNTVRVISLDPQDCLQPLSMQALPATPESLCIVEMAMGGLESESGRLGGLFLNIGLSVSIFVCLFFDVSGGYSCCCCCCSNYGLCYLQNGVLLRTVLDLVTGDLSDTRTR